MDTKLEWQTADIVRCLIGDGGDSQGHLETDGPGDGDSFDPTPIADKLREVALGLQRDAEFQRALVIFKKASQDEVISAFSQAVDVACGPPVPELAPEMHQLGMAVALCLYLKEKAPELNARIQEATTSFLNGRLGGFVAGQGGWGSVV